VRASLLAPLLLLLACQPPARTTPIELPPDVALTEVSVHSFRRAVLQLTATTPSLDFHRTGAQAGQLRSGPVQVELWGPGVRLSAREVIGDAFVGALVATEARALTPSGVEVASPRASFDRRQGAEGTAATDAGVAVRHPRFELDARAGRLDVATQQADLDDVVTRVAPSR
jgi:hypothetical protein